MYLTHSLFIRLDDDYHIMCQAYISSRLSLTLRRKISTYIYKVMNIDVTFSKRKAGLIYYLIYHKLPHWNYKYQFQCPVYHKGVEENAPFSGKYNKLLQIYSSGKPFFFISSAWPPLILTSYKCFFLRFS
jgi:hypothetical protein